MPRTPRARSVVSRKPETMVTPEPVGTVAPATPSKTRSYLLVGILSLLLVAALGAAGYFYWQYRHTPEVQNAEELRQLQDTLGKMVELPTNETPTLATVTDKEKLAGQPFFQRAQNGDKVLIYSQSGRAILYRPSSKKIIDITTVNTVSAPSSPAPAVPAEAPAPQTTPTDTTIPAASAPTTPTTVPVALLNGSKKLGITQPVEDELKTDFPEVSVVAKEKAAKDDYQATMVVDLSGKNNDLAGKIAASVKGTLAPLPTGETAPAGAEIVIILAKP